MRDLPWFLLLVVSLFWIAGVSPEQVVTAVSAVVKILGG